MSSWCNPNRERALHFRSSQVSFRDREHLGDHRSFACKDLALSCVLSFSAGEVHSSPTERFSRTCYTSAPKCAFPRWSIRMLHHLKKMHNMSFCRTKMLLTGLYPLWPAEVGAEVQVQWSWRLSSGAWLPFCGGAQMGNAGNSYSRGKTQPNTFPSSPF